MSTVTRWWWIRHAPVTVNEGRIYGQTDLPCDTQDSDAFAYLAGLMPQDPVLLTSTLQRTTQTAAAIAAAGAELPDPIQEPAFMEQSFGEWQGLTYDELGGMPGVGDRYWLAPAFERAPGGESFADLVARVVPAITRLTDRYLDRDIVAVTHGGTIRAAIGYATALDPEACLRFSIANLSVTRLDCIDTDEGRSWRIGFVNLRPPSAKG